MMDNTAQRGDSRFVLLTKYYSRDRTMDEDMAGACGAYGGEMEPGISVGNLKDKGANGRMLLQYVLKKRKRMGCHGLGSTGSGQEQVAGSCEHDDELSASIRSVEFLD
jgi:hypothetical protein